MAIRDLGVEIGVDIDESPFADLNREIDEIADMMRSLDIGVFDDMEREARALTGDFELMDGAVSEFDRSLSGIDDGSISAVSTETGIATKAMSALKVGVLAVGAAIGGLAISFGAFAMDADGAFGRLEAQTGASVEQLEVLKSSANETFARGYGESMQEVTDAISRVKQNMHDLEDEDLSDATANAMLLANVFDSEINEVTRGAQGLMDAFGISSDKAFDLFTKGGQNGINMSDDMFDQMGEFSAVAAQAGYSAEELFGVMSRGAQNGVYNMDRVNNAILEFGLRSTDGSKGTAAAMKDLSKDTQNLWKDMLAGKVTSKDLSTTVINELKAMDDQTLANEVGIALWGTTWEDNTKDVMYSMFETTEAMKGFEGATAAAADAVEGTFKNRMLGAWRELQIGITGVVDNPAAQEFFDEIATKAEELIPHILAGTASIFEFGNSILNGTSAIHEFVDTYGFMIAGVAGGAATYYLITGAVSAYNAMLLFAAGTGPIYTAVTAGMTTVTGAFGAAVAFATSPIFLIAAAIGAAIAIGVLLYKNWDTVILKAGQLKDGLGEKFTEIKSDITGALSPVLSLFDSLMSKWNNFKSTVSNFSISGAVDWVASKVPGFSSGIGRVPNDMVAEIHKDEAIIPAEDAQMLRDTGVIDGDGRYPNINMDNLSDAEGTYQTTKMTNNASTSVQAPVNIIVQGGNTNAETGQSIREALEDFFADLGTIMPQVREG
ncbi:phage tail tape measure protein [Solibacillus sp. FSL H8-0523]|uniref:phage tail tape measure protein n=1 Tax=Solibacillus sp. FSL H8-0523 TaxID=2954511 RepID=UPI0031010B27